MTPRDRMIATGMDGGMIVDERQARLEGSAQTAEQRRAAQAQRLGTAEERAETLRRLAGDDTPRGRALYALATSGDPVMAATKPHPLVQAFLDRMAADAARYNATADEK